jgi:hypothetical protein
MMLRVMSLALASAVFMALPAAAEPATPAAGSAQVTRPAVTKRVAAKRAAQRTLRRGPQSYGFLPGYEPPPDNNRPDYRRNARSVYADGRFVTWRGDVYYGWGRPGYVHGRWNGGSIGPCYTQTPIGLVWNCGR